MRTLFKSHTMQMVIFAAVLAVASFCGVLTPDVARAASFAGVTLAATHPTLLDLTSAKEGRIKDAMFTADELRRRGER